MADDNDQCRMQCALPRLIGIGRDAGGFNEAIERVVVRTKAFVVRQAASLVAIIVGEYNAGNCLSPHATAGLDVFRCGQRLAINDHQAQSLHIQPD